MHGNDRKPISFDPALFDMVGEYAINLSWSKRQFVQESVRAIIAMIETPPDQRTVPDMVRLLDGLRGPAARLPGDARYVVHGVPVTALNSPGAAYGAKGAGDRGGQARRPAPGSRQKPPVDAPSDAASEQVLDAALDPARQPGSPKRVPK